jgi:hypothetical protein
MGGHKVRGYGLDAALHAFTSVAWPYAIVLMLK